MEDDIVRGRCAAVVQQLLYSGEKRTVRPEQQRLIASAAEELRQRAMLLYRLCRAKHEKLASEQTGDAAYCVLAAASSFQPSLWAVLTNWSRALRPRAPELRFGAPVLVTVRVKEVEQFIARSLHLLPAPNTEDTTSPLRGGAKKHPREEEQTTGTKLEKELASQLAFDYFQLNVPNPKKFYAVVATFEKELGCVKLIDHREESAVTRGSTSYAPRNSKHNIGDGDGAGRNSHHNNHRGGAGPAPDEDEEEDDDMADYSFLFPQTSTSSTSGEAAFSLTSLHCFVSTMSLTAVADAVEATCSTLFFDRLQRCLRNPLLYSPLASMEVETTAGVSDDARHHPLLSASSSQLEAAYMFACQNTMVGSDRLLRFPTHFLHPLRARPTSLMPLPLQMVTAQQLWRRLLVSGLWLHVVGSSVDNGDASAQAEVSKYCITVVKAARRELCCSVCDTLVREKPVLRLSALAQEAETRDDSQPICTWEEMKRVGVPNDTTHTSLCNELVHCLSHRLEQKVREQSGSHAGSHTLLQLLMDIEGDYPISACRAALLGGPENETALLQLLGDASVETHTATIVQEVKGLLDAVPCIPRLREVDGVLECAACLQQFHQGCVCPVQREPAEGFFLCHACRLARGPRLLPSLRCSAATN